MRGGAYNKEKSNSAAGSIAKLEKVDAVKKEASQKEKEMRDKIAELTAENARLKSELDAAKESVELVKKAAMLEASQKAAEQMLQRYKDGLRDGASLSSGSFSIRGLSSSTPDSSSAFTPSPASFMPGL